MAIKFFSPIILFSSIGLLFSDHPITFVQSHFNVSEDESVISENQ